MNSLYSYSTNISHSRDGIIDAEVRELELEVTSLRKRRYTLERALIKAHKEIARLQKEVKI